MLKVTVTSSLLTLLLFTAQIGLPQKPGANTVTTAEPGIYKLEDLYQKADTVALVKILSGDTEHYDVAVYKAEVVEGFKGAAAKQIVYFGPFIGHRLGWEYVVFLRTEKKPHTPNRTPGANYGVVAYAAVFNQGYTSMETGYQCVFEGKETKEQCDYGVRVCTDYILLSKSTPVFPPMSENTAFGCRWVRKTAFLPLLRSFER
ncbi:MAG TPA: hypothetical protein VI488_01890 [Candidatus Angelobacter sp.]